MASAPAPSHRASLLAGLRTGGVRSVPMASVPHTAAPGTSFNIPSRFSSATYNQPSVSEDDDQLSDLLSQSMYINAQQRFYQPPNTAAVDGRTNRFAQQQSHFPSGLMSGIAHPNSAAQLQVQAQQQALQMQLVQLELMRMQVCHPLSPFVSLIVDLRPRLCRPSKFMPSCWLRVVSRTADHTCPPQLLVPQHSRSISIRPP
jgi:cell fate (sporulation/competence/biofilm development) regulator YlbF (YheA/YmcA/DUF963 family)